MRKQPPSHIVREIQRYDPLLRIRWSREKRKFCVERKCFRGLLQKPIRYSKGEDGRIVERRIPELSDCYQRYRDGYVEILSTAKLDRRIFWEIFESDTQRYRDVTREQEERERKVKENIDRQSDEELLDVGGEAHDHLQWINGSRSGASGGKTTYIPRI